MIDAGIPIIKCLDILESQTKEDAMKAVINATRKDVKGGLSLTDAISKHPNAFSKLYINMIRAAEIGGILDVILDRLAGFLEKEMEIRGKIKSAMMYPIIVLNFAGVMVIALFMFVLPRFKEIFLSMNVEMPPVTLALFAVGDWLQNFWWVVIILGVGRVYRRSSSTTRRPKATTTLTRCKLKAPIFGDLSLKLSIARFCPDIRHADRVGRSDDALAGNHRRDVRQRGSGRVHCQCAGFHSRRREDQPAAGRVGPVPGDGHAHD